MNQDEQYLNLLAIFHYVVGGLIGLFACVFLVHVAIGVAMLSGAFPGPDAPPPMFGAFFVVFGTLAVTAGWTVAILVIVTGLKLARHRSRTFCLVVAGIECLVVPFGTVLGVFTIVLLMKESVEQLFGE